MKNLFIGIFLIIYSFTYSQTGEDYYKGAEHKILQNDLKMSYGEKQDDELLLGAISDFNKAIRLLYNNTKLRERAFNDRGYCKSQLGDHSGAIRDYTIYLNSNNFNNDSKWGSYSWRADSKFELQDYRGAIQDYTKSIDISGTGYDYVNRGLCKINIGDINSACLDFSKAGEKGKASAYDYIKKYCN